MFGVAKSPVSPEAGEWIERSLQRFVDIFGAESATTAQIVLPTPEFFPDEGETSEQRVRAFFVRTCRFMNVAPDRIDLCYFEDDTEGLQNSLKDSLPHWEGSHEGAAGYYQRPTDDTGRTIIAIKQKQLADPVALVATLAHEVGHELLLGGGHIDRNEPDMEPLTDLITVFRGLGIFTANSAFKFRQYSDGQRAGWSVHRQGYLSEPMFGYALACWARLRHERNPSWTKHLKTNVAHYFKQSASHLAGRRPDRYS